MSPQARSARKFISRFAEISKTCWERIDEKTVFSRRPANQIPARLATERLSRRR